MKYSVLTCCVLTVIGLIAARPDALKAGDTKARMSRDATIPLATAELARIIRPSNSSTGEQIKWQVIAGGGGRGTSTNYVLSGTAGQTAAGPGASTNYKINQGFWQNFGGCCTGTKANVNAAGIVDLSDLSALVSYLTGGGYMLPNCP